jgi:hypothetical protein
VTTCGPRSQGGQHNQEDKDEINEVLNWAARVAFQLSLGDRWPKKKNAALRAKAAPNMGRIMRETRPEQCYRNDGVKR